MNHNITSVHYYYCASAHLEGLLGRLALLISTAVLLDGRLSRVLVLDEVFYLGRVHQLDDVVSLPLLEAEAQAFVRIVFVVCLIFMVLDLDKVRVYGVRVEGQ